MILAVINGGLGFRFAGIGSPGAPKAAVVVYTIVAGVVGGVYISIILFSKSKRKIRRPENEPCSERGAMGLKPMSATPYEHEMSRDPNIRYDPAPDHEVRG